MSQSYNLRPHARRAFRFYAEAPLEVQRRRLVRGRFHPRHAMHWGAPVPAQLAPRFGAELRPAVDTTRPSNRRALLAWVVEQCLPAKWQRRSHLGALQRLVQSVDATTELYLPDEPRPGGDVYAWLAAEAGPGPAAAADWALARALPRIPRSYRVAASCSSFLSSCLDRASSDDEVLLRALDRVARFLAPRMAQPAPPHYAIALHRGLCVWLHTNHEQLAQRPPLLHRFAERAEQLGLRFVLGVLTEFPLTGPVEPHSQPRSLQAAAFNVLKNNGGRALLDALPLVQHGCHDLYRPYAEACGVADLQRFVPTAVFPELKAKTYACFTKHRTTRGYVYTGWDARLRVQRSTTKPPIIA